MFNKRKKALKEEEARILKEMDLLDPKSREYSVLCDRLDSINKLLYPETGGGLKVWIPVIAATITGAFSVYNVKQVTKVDEDPSNGKIVSTKAFPFIRKP